MERATEQIEEFLMFVDFWRNSRLRNKVILVGIAVLVMLWILSHAWTEIVPFVFALALGYLLLPLIDRLSTRMPRVAAILLVYVIFFGSLIGLGFLVVPQLVQQVSNLIDNAPKYGEQVTAYTGDLQTWYQSLDIPADVRTSIENAIRNSSSGATNGISTAIFGTLRAVTGALSFVFGLLILPFWLFYFMKDRDLFVRGFYNMIPAAARDDIRRVFSISSDVLNDYIRGQLFLGLAVGISTTIGMFVVGAPYWLLLGVIYGLTEIVPVLGPIIGAVPGLILAALTGDITVFFKVLAVYIVVQQLENNFLVPKIQGDSVKLHASVIILALIIGGAIGGLIGLIVAVPVTAIARDVYLYLYRRFGDGYSPQEAESMVPSRVDENKTEAKAEATAKLSTGQ